MKKNYLKFIAVLKKYLQITLNISLEMVKTHTFGKDLFRNTGVLIYANGGLPQHSYQVGDWQEAENRRICAENRRIYALLMHQQQLARQRDAKKYSLQKKQRKLQRRQKHQLDRLEYLKQRLFKSETAISQLNKSWQENLVDMESTQDLMDYNHISYIVYGCRQKIFCKKQEKTRLETETLKMQIKCNDIKKLLMKLEEELEDEC